MLSFCFFVSFFGSLVCLIGLVVSCCGVWSVRCCGVGYKQCLRFFLFVCFAGVERSDGLRPSVWFSKQNMHVVLSSVGCSLFSCFLRYILRFLSFLLASLFVPFSLSFLFISFLVCLFVCLSVFCLLSQFPPFCRSGGGGCLCWPLY